MKVIISSTLLDTALQIAEKQFEADAETCAKAGDRRTMAGFLEQADAIRAFRDVFDNNVELSVIEAWQDPHHKVRGYKRVTDIVREERTQTYCFHCDEKQSDHVDGVKCPFGSTFFKRKIDP